MNFVKGFRNGVERLDEVGVSWLLAIDALVATLVIVAHGGAYILVRVGKGAGAPANAIDIAMTTVPIAVIAIVLSILGMVRPRLQWMVLKIHAPLFLAGAALLFYYSVAIVASNAAYASRFTWNPLLFAFLVTYPVYLARRAFLPTAAPQFWILKYAHVLAAVCALVISFILIGRYGSSA